MSLTLKMVTLVHDYPSIAKDVASACVVGDEGCDDEFISDMITAQMALAVRSGLVVMKKKSSLSLTEIRARNAAESQENYPSNLTKTYEGVQYGYDPDTNIVIDLNDFSEMGKWSVRVAYDGVHRVGIDFTGRAQAKHDQYVLKNQ